MIASFTIRFFARASVGIIYVIRAVYDVRAWMMQ